MKDSPLRHLAVACHIALTLVLAISALSGGVAPARLGVFAVMATPLLGMLYALLTRRPGAERWLSVLLVPYAGAISVEVVARAGAAPLLDAALLICVLEISLLLALIRAGSRLRGARE